MIDPRHGIDRLAPLYIAAGKVAAIGDAPAGWTANRTLDAKGLVVAPGIIGAALERQASASVCGCPLSAKSARLKQQMQYAASSSSSCAWLP